MMNEFHEMKSKWQQINVPSAYLSLMEVIKPLND
jgi:hypothetical protein